MTNETVRTRFAPSPTGRVHIGNIRVAIFNWLFARSRGGRFLLRLEDTDRERSTPEAIDNLFRVLDWLGIQGDEDPVYQSANRQAHLQAAEALVEAGRAYRADKGGTGQGEAILFRVPEEDMTYRDRIKGELRRPAGSVGDFVIVRSDGHPVFHLANVLDDIAMGVTHVIRGDDHVDNTFKHLALYRALDADPPEFAHLPMIVNDRGKPYSKRDGDAYAGDFMEKGYLPGALFNYLSLLGWSPGDDREIMSREELVEAFSLERVQASPARFDPVKLDWMNGVAMRSMPRGMLVARAQQDLQAEGLEVRDGAYLLRVIEVLGDRIHFFHDIPEQSRFFFTDEYSYDEKAVRKRLLKEGALERLTRIRERFAGAPSFTAENLERALREAAEERNESAGMFIHPVRVAVSGSMTGPSLFEMLEILGKDRVLDRIDRTIQTYGTAAV